MTYIARFVTVAEYKNLTDRFKPFVNYHSSLENFEVSEHEKIAILQIEGTESYFPIFINKKPTIEQIEEKLAKQETRLNTETKKLLLKYLSDS